MFSLSSATTASSQGGSHKPRSSHVAAATPAERYAKAAVKYSTGARPQLLYTRPDLSSLLDLELNEAVKAHSSRAAQDPQLYAHKLAMQRQLEESETEHVNWSEIL
jgi:hypothetical protein